MRFDTKEAFYKATYRLANMTPIEAARAFQFPQDENHDPEYWITGAIVKLMEGAFEVHERASAQIGPGDDLLGYRIAEAERTLPEGWQLVVQVKNQETTVDLYNPSDERMEFPTARGSMSGQVSDAMRFAINSAPSSSQVAA